jgi:1-deoxy-D-xylulose-5-phosphate synthase
MRFLKPLDEKTLEEFTSKYSVWITVEDGTEKGGLFSEVAEFLENHSFSNQLLHIALPDRFISHGDIPHLYKEVGFDEESITRKVRQAWQG